MYLQQIARVISTFLAPINEVKLLRSFWKLEPYYGFPSHTKLGDIREMRCCVCVAARQFRQEWAGHFSRGLRLQPLRKQTCSYKPLCSLYKETFRPALVTWFSFRHSTEYYFTFSFRGVCFLKEYSVLTFYNPSENALFTLVYCWRHGPKFSIMCNSYFLFIHSLAISVYCIIWLFF